jgi:hypothetical protein
LGAWCFPNMRVQPLRRALYGAGLFYGMFFVLFSTRF